MNIRNCTESDILKALGGTELQCKGTQAEILNNIITELGGTATGKANRNDLLRDILALS